MERTKRPRTLIALIIVAAILAVVGYLQGTLDNGQWTMDNAPVAIAPGLDDLQ